MATSAMKAARDEGQLMLNLAQDRAGKDDPSFGHLVREFILQYLRANGPTSGEIITNAAKRSGLVPKDDRAFGGSYAALQRRGFIMVDGHMSRFKGHGTFGAKLWRLTRAGGDAQGCE
jgi:hypothetical protein